MLDTPLPLTKKVKKFCPKCGRLLLADEFYTSYRTDRYPPDGKIPECKKCWTMHVDNWNPDTFRPLLEALDIPYIKEEWNALLAKYGNDITKVNGTTILGRYISKMRLNQYKAYRYADSEKIEKERKELKIKALKLQGMTDEAIEAYLNRDYTPMKPYFNEKGEMVQGNYKPQIVASKNTAGFNPAAFVVADLGLQGQRSQSNEIEDNLTEKDKLYLKLKWGDTYSAEEWVKLEQLYKDMEASYDIQTAGHRDILVLACKASLKANKLMDIDDVDGAQRMTKIYDTLMKAGKFTAAQNKEETGDSIDCVGALVSLCETEGFIPRYYTDGPQDKLDRIIQDQQKYVRDLVTEEVGLGSLIENAVAAIQEEKERIESAAQTAENFEDNEEDEMFNYNNSPLSDDDILALDEARHEFENDENEKVGEN